MPMPSPPTAPTSLRSLTATAQAFQAVGRNTEALSWLRRALALDPADVTAVNASIRLLLSQQKIIEAVAVLEMALSRAPFDIRLLAEQRAIGLALYQAGFWEDAVPWLERASALEPWNPTLTAALARTRRPAYLGPDVIDARTGQPLQRYAAREGSAYIYVIDIVGTCNLRCPTCPVGNSDRGARPVGFMPIDLFEAITAKIRQESPSPEPVVNLYNWGEPLLHPDLPQMIRRLRSLGLRSSLSSNLNIKRGLEEVIAANPDELKISLSGFTPQTYSRTHARGDLDRVKANMRAIRRHLDTYHSKTHVWVGHHIYKSNQDQAETVRRFCAELGFAYHPIPAFYMPLERLMDVIDGKPNPRDGGILADLLHAPAGLPERAAKSRSGTRDCELRFNQTVINFDGSVALCCTVYDQANMLGLNFMDADFSEIERRKYAHPFCSTCYDRKLEYAPPELDVVRGRR